MRLKLLAWDPANFGRVSLVLARLARLDPGGALTDRPIDSLQALFSFLIPNTVAPLKVQMAALDAIMKQKISSDTAWLLLTKLLPRDRNPVRITRRPRKPQFNNLGDSRVARGPIGTRR